MSRGLHKYSAEQKGRLEQPKRQMYLPARELLQLMGLQRDMKIADVGCGTGYFSFPASSLVGEKGEVFALDISEDMVLTVNDKIQDLGIKNMITILTEEYDLKLKDETVDMVLICTTLHEVDESYRMLWECRRILAPGGKCVVIEWIKHGPEEGHVDEEWGPPLSHRLPMPYVEQKMKSAGYTDVVATNYNQHFYYVVGVKG